jgi:XTP/dITP diphosphohydrolase
VTQLTLVTSNAEKVREVRDILRPYGIEVRARRRTLPEPQVDSLEEVVGAKLASVRDLPGWVAVEDSGIHFTGLSGFPGVYSAYAFRTIGLEGMLRLLKGRSRMARFRTVAGLRRGRQSWMFVGEVRGRAAPGLRGRGGFGYDPLFIPDGHPTTFGEMTPTEKSAISHRARAFQKLGRFLARSRPEK